MRQVAGQRFFIGCIVLGSLWGGFSSVYAAEVAPFVIVTGKNSSSFSGIDKTTLSRLFLRVTSEIDGEGARPFNFSDELVKWEFLELLTGKNKEQLEEHFVKLELQGRGRWPAEGDSAKDVIKWTMRSKKVIAWLPVAEYQSLSASLRVRLKVLKLDMFSTGE